MRRASYKGVPGAWKGTIREGGQVVWECPHVHRNRDHGRQVSALQCAHRYLHNPESWERQEATRVAWVESVRANGWR
jgi:hypothetical protein